MNEQKSRQIGRAAKRLNLEQEVLKVQVFWFVKKESARSAETAVSYRDTTWRHNPQDLDLYTVQ
jgi:hypothetical protein